MRIQCRPSQDPLHKNIEDGKCRCRRLSGKQELATVTAIDKRVKQMDSHELS